jgi:PleD family two-component response regulator
VQQIKSDLKKSVGKTVLVGDDNAAIRKMIAAAFLSDGFKTCVEAENGSEAIDTAKHIQPGLITLDVSMPVMNGLDGQQPDRRNCVHRSGHIASLCVDSGRKADAVGIRGARRYR